jgi:hypothetical protein
VKYTDKDLERAMRAAPKSMWGRDVGWVAQEFAAVRREERNALAQRLRDIYEKHAGFGHAAWDLINELESGE